MAAIVNDRDLILQATNPRLVATSVAISADGAMFTKLKNGGVVTPVSITLTAITTVFLSPSYTWEYSLSTAPDTWIATGTGTNTLVLTGSTIPGIYGDASSATYRVTCAQSGYTSASNTFTITYLEEADEPIEIVLSRTATVINATNSGVPNGYDNTGTVLQVRRGSTYLDYGASGANTFSISGVSITPTGMVTLGTPSSSGTQYTYPNITAMDNDTDSVTAQYTFSIRDASGNSIPEVFTGVQTFTKVKDGADGAAGGLSLAVAPDRVFVYADTSATSSATGDKTFTATLTGITGSCTWKASAYNFSHVYLGDITSTLTISGNTAVMSAADFNSLGGTTTFYVLVEVFVGALSDEERVFRVSGGATGYALFIEDTTLRVQTNRDGTGGDYSTAVTDIGVYKGDGTNDSINWTFSITPGPGVTARINGGTASVSGTAGPITINITNMTVDNGTVVVTAVKGATTLTDTITITKDKAGDTGYYYQLVPSDTIHLKADAQGNVLSYEGATASMEIYKGGTSDTSNWTFSKVDTNVTSTLATNAVTVTNFGGSSSSTTQSSLINAYASEWVASNNVISMQMAYGGGVLVCFALTYPTTTNKVMYSSDNGSTWNSATLPVTSDLWCTLKYANGKFILLRQGGYGCYSTNGSTWSAMTNNSAFNDTYFMDVVWTGSTYIACGQNTSSYSDIRTITSSDGITWATGPAIGVSISDPGTIVSLTVTSTGNVLLVPLTSSRHFARSSNHGSSWTVDSFWNHSTYSPVCAPIVYKGVTVMKLGNMIYTSSNNGLNWTSRYDFGATDNSPINDRRGTKFYVFNNVLILLDSSVLAGMGYVTSDFDTWEYVSVTNPYSPSGNPSTTFCVPNEKTSGSNFPIITSKSATFPNSTPQALIVTPKYKSLVAGTIAITAHNTAGLVADKTMIVNVVLDKGTVAMPTSYIYPGNFALPATSDGVVTSYANAVFTVTVYSNTMDETSLWTYNWTIPTSVTGTASTNTYTVSTMADATDIATITCTATRNGYPTQTVKAQLSKIKGSTGSGVVIEGATYSYFTSAYTSLGLRFSTDGTIQLKKGTGSWATVAEWYGLAPTSGIGNSKYIRVVESGAALDASSSARNTWLALSSDRDYYLIRTSTGVSTTTLKVYISDSATGNPAVMGSGILEVEVP